MIIYCIIVFLIAILFVVGACIFRGNVGLIHNYHQTKVKDKIGYGKSMGKAITGIGISALVSGVVSVISSISTFIAVGIFVAGLIISFSLYSKSRRSITRKYFSWINQGSL